MPSPSRIPRCVVKGVNNNPEKHAPQKTLLPQPKCLTEKNEPILAIQRKKVGPKRLKQPNPVNQETKNVAVVKKCGSDRRGISEIKRSEQSLQAKLKESENELEGFKLKLTQSVHERQDKENIISDLQQNEYKLKEEIKQMNVRNLSLVEKLESLNIDPISGEQIKFHQDCTGSLELAKQEEKVNVENLLSSLEDMDKVWEDTENLLNAVKLPEISLSI
ncbi:uncharacterized protein LOC100178423 [Ciona intestinalis]